MPATIFLRGNDTTSNLYAADPTTGHTWPLTDTPTAKKNLIYDAEQSRLLFISDGQIAFISTAGDSAAVQYPQELFRADGEVLAFDLLPDDGGVVYSALSNATNQVKIKRGDEPPTRIKGWRGIDYFTRVVEVHPTGAYFMGIAFSSDDDYPYIYRFGQDELTELDDAVTVPYLPADTGYVFAAYGYAPYQSALRAVQYRFDGTRRPVVDCPGNQHAALSLSEHDYLVLASPSEDRLALVGGTLGNMCQDSTAIHAPPSRDMFGPASLHIAAPGGQPERVFDAELVTSAHAFSPNGEHMTFTTQSDGTLILRILDVKIGQARIIARDVHKDYYLGGRDNGLRVRWTQVNR